MNKTLDLAPAAGRDYEFDAQENAQFQHLARAMFFVGNVQIVLGVLGCLVGTTVLMLGLFSNATSALIQSILMLLMGVWTRRAAGSVQKVVETEGADILHLMKAIEGLGKLYGLQRALLIVALAVFVLAFVAGIIMSIGAR